ncbi:MAG: transglycosylase SLT domain-containing protein [Gammaproteobacteria bacterium]|nr:transglycosylase SLT domain-containing protein [Gammaproteobacteria bacterium]
MRLARAGALLLALAAGAAPAVEPVDSLRWSREYDPLFQKYAKHYFGPHFDWLWFKAQAITESNLEPRARSVAGAVGLMQILPSTFAEIRAANPHFVDIDNPRWNIAAGIYYDRYLYRQPVWDALADEEQLLLAFASYNAGLGGVLRAHAQTPPPVDSWLRVAPRAPQETQAYVARIVTVKTGAPIKRPPLDRRGYSRHSMKAVEPSR